METVEGSRRRVFVAGATGYIGRHAVRELVERGCEVVSFARPRAGVGGADDAERTHRRLAGSEVRFGDVCEPHSVAADGLRGERFDAMVCCLTTRTGGIADAWRIDYQATRNVMEAGRDLGVGHFVLLSAICVQKPELEFQRAKLRAERELIESGLTYSIVRPTAFFKSLAGQVERIKQGRAYVMFGDGAGAACKPIGERDLARYMADCLDDPQRWNRILPVGGPGPAVTALDRGRMLFELTGRKPRYRRVPVKIFDALIPVLGGLARVFPGFRDRAEFARIGRYYASESMLWMDPQTGEYDESMTPSYGDETLRQFYARVVGEGLAGQELGDHALF